MKTKLTFLLSLTFLFLFGGSVYGDDYMRGINAAKKGDYETAYKLWLPLAEKNNAIAQFNLGTLYDQGKGVPQSFMRSYQWYKLSAEQG